MKNWTKLVEDTFDCKGGRGPRKRCPLARGLYILPRNGKVYLIERYKGG